VALGSERDNEHEDEGDWLGEGEEKRLTIVGGTGFKRRQHEPVTPVEILLRYELYVFTVFFGHVVRRRVSCLIHGVRYEF
jgi:hypothetical protein